MNWEQAEQHIRGSILQGTRLSQNSKYRTIENTPPYKCTTYNYAGIEGFRVRIGTAQFIEIPISMLKILFLSSTDKSGTYNNGILKKHYPQQLANHGCHVHVIGKIFELAGICDRKGSNYKLR